MPTGRRSGALCALVMLAVVGCSYRRSSPDADASDDATHDGGDETTADGGNDATDARDAVDEPGPLPPGGGDVVAFQIDPAHTGNQPDSTLTPPLKKRWSIDLGGAVSYPLIAGGRVFITVVNQSGIGMKLHAIDLSSGDRIWDPIALQTDYTIANAAYDEGRLYVLGSTGVLTAFDAETGGEKWSVKMPQQFMFTSPPTAMGGFVFVGGAGAGGTVYGVQGATGDVKWMASVVGGDRSAPAVSADGVYVSYACVQAHGFNPTDGMQLWHHRGPCSGAGGRTAALYGGRVWARDDITHVNLLLDAATGAERGTFDAGPIPAFAGDQGFFLTDGTLRAHPIDLSTTPWFFTGDDMLVSAPIVANGFVYVGSSDGNLYAVDAVTGTMLWSDMVGAPIAAPDELNLRLNRPLTGLAAGGNALLVPAGSLLVCYQ